jgi:Na+/H+ antiporter NhaD/arsenite permease-like protein
MTPIVVIVFTLFVLATRVLFRKSFEFHPERVDNVMALKERKAITDPRLLVRCMIVFAGIIAAFALHSVLHLEPSVVALVGAGVMLLVSRVDVMDSIREVEWETLVFFMGLFVMVGGLVDTGVIAAAGDAAASWVGDDLLLAATLLIFGSALLGAFFDNIPYVTAMSPIVEDIAAHAPAHLVDPLWWAFALGADFGGNGTAVAASANIVVLGIAARAGERIGFWQFTRYGIVTTVMSTVLAWLYIWLRYFVLGQAS